MRNTHFSSWNKATKTEKGGTFRNVHCSTMEYGKKTENHGK